MFFEETRHLNETLSIKNGKCYASFLVVLAILVSGAYHPVTDGISCSPHATVLFT